MATSEQRPMPAPPKKTSPILWIIVGILGFFMAAGLAIIAGGLFVAKKAHDAAVNPAPATAKIKQGKLTFEGSTPNGIDMTGSDGSTVQIGANASTKLPDWLPVYPGSSAQGTFAMQ